jgi:hypothetical protein
MFRASTDHYQQAHVYNTIIKPYFHLQYVERSEVHQCMIYRDDMWTLIGPARRSEGVHGTPQTHRLCQLLCTHKSINHT